MRRNTDCIKYSPVKDNFSFAQRHAFKEFYIEACLKKNILLSDITFTDFNNTLIVNLHILYRTKRLLSYRRQLKYKRKLAFKKRRKIRKILRKYSSFYFRRLKRIKTRIQNKLKYKKLIKFKFIKSKAKFFVRKRRALKNKKKRKFSKTRLKKN